jgi:hypothetical protein
MTVEERIKPNRYHYEVAEIVAMLYAKSMFQFGLNLFSAIWY